MQRAHCRGDRRTVVRVAGALWRFWWAHGHLAEGCAWLEAAVAAADVDREIPRAERENAFNGAGAMVYLLGDWRRGEALYERALDLRRAAGEPPVHSFAASDAPQRFRAVGRTFVGEVLHTVEHVDIEAFVHAA
jgi:hypothetical protein